MVYFGVLNMNSYIYSRLSPRNRSHEMQLAQLNVALPGAMLFEDKVRGNVPAFEREGFSQLLDTLQAGDTLAVWWLNVFGADFRQSSDVVEHLLSKGVRLMTLCERLTFNPNSSEASVLLSVLKGYAQVERFHRLHAAELGRQALKADPQAWKDKFRGRPANREKHHQIATLLLAGRTLQQVADEVDASLSTVKRVKSRIIEQDDEGQLRLRSKHHRKK